MSKVKAERFRVMAAECERQAALADGEEEFREIQEKLARSYHALAENEDWLDGRAVNIEGVSLAPAGEANRQFEAA
jgi:hypothetical protein